MRNVLVIAYYFPPMGLSGVQRTLKFVKYLPEHGWNPIVLTYTPSMYYAFDESLESELGETIIYRTEPEKKNKQDKKTVKYPSRLADKLRKIIVQTLMQPDSKVGWKKYALKKAEEIYKEHKVDVVFTTAPPFTDFLIARELNKRYGTPFLADYRDLWVDNAYYYYSTPFHRMYSMGLERDILNSAGKVVVISRDMKEKLLQRYKLISHNDITIIPHGYDSSDFENVDFVKDDTKFTITHTGLFPDDLTPRYFLKALSRFFANNPKAKKETELRLVGLMKKEHLNLLKKYKLDEITKTPGYVNHSESVKNLLESDLLWMMIPNKLVTPGRLFEYIGADKPILLNAPEGSMRKLATDTKAAIVSDVKDIGSIEKAIASFYKLWKSGSLPKPSREYTANFDRRYLAGELARELSLIAEI